MACPETGRKATIIKEVMANRIEIIPNPSFELCRISKEEWTKRFDGMYVYPDDEPLNRRCYVCGVRQLCNMGETLQREKTLEELLGEAVDLAAN